MIKENYQKILRKTERGQAIILVAFAIIGLVAMVGLVTDTGMLLIEYGKLKRGVDAAAVAAAQQYHKPTSGNELDKVSLENAARNFLQLNQSSDVTSIIVNSCEDEEDTFTDENSSGTWDAGEPLIQDWNGNGSFDTNRPALCNPDPEGHPEHNRKLVEVVASKTVTFGFLRVIGFDTTTVTASSTGEAATIDLVLVIDTSASMAFETDPNGDDFRSDPLEDPSECNDSNTCQPLRAVKDIALDFIETLYFRYDRVAVVALTSQTPEGSRHPTLVLALNSDRDTVRAAISGLRVYEPRACDGDPDAEGSCLNYFNGTFLGTICQRYEMNPTTADPSSCTSSNVGGALRKAGDALSLDPNPRLDAFWVVVTLLGGPANATYSDNNDPPNYPNGFCPQYTFYWEGRFCRDKRPSERHADDDPLVPYTNPYTLETTDISYYDADDYARDMADGLAGLISGEGVTIYTIGLGAQIESTNPYEVDPGEVPIGKALLTYIAECAGEDSPDDCETPLTDPQLNHGQYFYAPNSDALADIFDRIAKNIATKISQ